MILAFYESIKHFYVGVWVAIRARPQSSNTRGRRFVSASLVHIARQPTHQSPRQKHEKCLVQHNAKFSTEHPKMQYVSRYN